ncbi:MAG: PilN domain-containing protein [Pyrinomonadaceae bacterium]
MITKLNLSSHPFRNRTLPYVLSLLLVAFAVAGAVLSFARLNYIANENEIAKSQMQEMQTQLKELNQKGELVQQQLTPQEQALLIAAHKLVANKNFGWSHLFADLESVLPGSVSVSRISVENIYKTAEGRTQAELDFAVLSRDYQSVLTMIERMNNSGAFQADLRGQDLQKSEHFSYTEYTLHLVYRPSGSYSVDAPPSDVAQNQ